ncbi:MAG: FtsX-like permease family protein [Gemmatimonadetes bacterium]|nr:FtsX-like permease family protein [Gemmatimonadota bacterium]NIO33350.1 FtsX-like permease family protein [Gemmatimonadota bacterium]
MIGLLLDIRHGLRLLYKRVGFTAVALLTIGVGVAATTTVFSVIEGTLLRPWPFPGSERLVVPLSTRPAQGRVWSSVNYGDYEDWHEAGVFEHVAVSFSGSVDLADGSGEPERIRATQFSEDYFATLGVAPTLGRLPAAEEHGPGAPPVALLSYGLWQSRFGGDREVVGRTIRLNGEPVTVIGVMPAELDVFPAVLFVPLRPSPRALVGWRDRDNYAFASLARLRPGQTIDQARAHLQTIAARIESEWPQLREGVSADLVPLSERVIGEEIRTMLWVMLGAVAFVLLIGCVNLANLLLARATGRARELAIRTAVGAGRGRLLRQLLVESLVLALAGGVLGLLLSVGGIRILVALAPADVPRISGVGLNTMVLGFALLVSLASALVFGLLPALRATSLVPAPALADAAFGSTRGQRGRRSLGALVAAELALAVVLLAGAGLMLRSVAGLRDVDPGFEVENMLTFKLTLPPARYERGRPLADAYARLRERLQAIPGVESATVTSALPLGGGGFILFRAHLPEGRPEPPEGEEVRANWDVVQPGYFATMGLPLVAGRGFTEADDESSVPVMIVNREFARVMFGSVGDALGARVRSWRDENIYREIVGIVENVRYFGAGDEIRGVVYVPHRQVTWRGMAVAVRTATDPENVVSAVRAAVRDFDPNIALASFTTMSQTFEDSVAERRFAATLLTAFAALALLLAAMGIYGVLSYAVAQRTREFGVRMALGARAADVRLMVLREAGVSVLIGVSLGLAGALAITRVMSGMLFGVTATDPLTFGGAIVVLITTALAASWMPALRATHVDPMQAMRPD